MAYAAAAATNLSPTAKITDPEGHRLRTDVSIFVVVVDLPLSGVRGPGGVRVADTLALERALVELEADQREDGQHEHGDDVAVEAYYYGQQRTLAEREDGQHEHGDDVAVEAYYYGQQRSLTEREGGQHEHGDDVAVEAYYYGQQRSLTEREDGQH